MLVLTGTVAGSSRPAIRCGASCTWPAYHHRHGVGSTVPLNARSILKRYQTYMLVLALLEPAEKLFLRFCHLGRLFVDL